MFTLEQFQALRHRQPLSTPINLEMSAGSVLALVGPNGVGKSTLLSALAQTGTSSSGSARLDGVDLRSLSPRRRAAQLSLLAQFQRGADDMTVRQLVDVGVYANPTPFAGSEFSRAESAMRTADVIHLADRRLGTLSGGQRQAAHLARVMAQDTRIVLLDEPASALDLGHRAAVEVAVRHFADEGRIVIAAVHDLDFAFAVAERALLLMPDGTWHFGSPAETLTSHMLQMAYGVRVNIFDAPSGRTVLVPETF